MNRTRAKRVLVEQSFRATLTTGVVDVGRVGDGPFDTLEHGLQLPRWSARSALSDGEPSTHVRPALLELRVTRRSRLLWACAVALLLLFAGRFLFLSVEHLLMLNRYVSWSSTGNLPAVLADDQHRLQLPAEMQDRLITLMLHLNVASEQREALQESRLIVPENEGSTSEDVCRIEYGASPRDLCRSLAKLPDNKTWKDLQPSLQSLLAAFASAMPTKREVGCNGAYCYPGSLASWLGLGATRDQGYPLVTPLIYLADDSGDVDNAASSISYPKRTVSSGYKIGDRPWYRMPVEGDESTWLTLGNSHPVARCGLTDPYQDVGSVLGIVRTLVCWPYADVNERKHPRFVLAIDLWWEDKLPVWPDTAIEAALRLEQTLPVSLAIVALLACLLALVSLRHRTQRSTYLVRSANLEGSARDKSIVRQVGSQTERQVGVKLAGSLAALFSAETTRRHHNAQTESLVLRIDYEHDPDVRGLELWEIYTLEQHCVELLGLRVLVRLGVHAPRWTSLITHTAQSLPRIEYVGGGSPEPGLRERIEAHMLAGTSGELSDVPPLAGRWIYTRAFHELNRHHRQAQRIRAGRFRFKHGLDVIQSLYPQAEVESVHRLPDLLRTLTGEHKHTLQLGNLHSRVILCDNTQAWQQARETGREQLLTLAQLVSSGRLRVGFLDRLGMRLQRFNASDFGLLDKRTLIVFDQDTGPSATCSGYVSTKRADLAFYRFVFDALWSTSERFEV